MKIHQVRLGHATNSSSAHSLIILPGLKTGHSSPVRYDGEGGEWDDEETYCGKFGWKYFTASSPKAKAMYAAEQLRTNMGYETSSEVAYAVAEKWARVRITPGPEEFGGYVDHQSVWTLPRDWESVGVDREFFADLYKFLLRPDVVVLGGNDNDERNHPLDDGSSFQLPLPQDTRDFLVARKDPKQGYWTLFNRATGDKIRMSFGNDGKAVTPTKATAPELVDVKITDYCPHGCDFCYQDSTTTGEHADKDFLYQLARHLGDLRVFEVALGGGEPTLHPNFLDILEGFRSFGVIPNFTTRRLDWLHNHPVRQTVMRQIGAFAYSVRNVQELDELASIRDCYGLGNQVHAQYVMGTEPSTRFQGLLEKAGERHIRLTLLGYKADGRGKDYNPYSYEDWVGILKKLSDVHRAPRVGIDTALARDYQSQLNDLGVPIWCYEVEEGKFSMYLDAVGMKTAKASYGPDLTFHDLPAYEKYRPRKLGVEIVDHFSRY